MSDVVVSVTESTTAVTVTEQDVAVAVTENTVEVSSSTAGVQGATGATGAQGASGVISVTSPVTNSGSASSAVLGLDQTALSLTRSQITDFTSGTVTSASTAQQAGTAVFASFSGVATSATSASTATNAGTAVYATTSGTAVTISGSITQSQVTSLVTDLANRAKLDTANAFTVGGHVITNAATAVVPLVLKGAASQTASVLALQNSAGSITANFTAPVNNVNRLNLGGTDLSATFGITVHASGGVGQVIRGAASQSASLQEWQNSAGTVLAKVGSTGDITAGYAYLSGLRDTAGTGPYINTTTTNVLLNARTATNKGLVIQGAASQSANLQEWQDSFGNVHSGILSTGFLFLGGSSSAGGQLGITAEAATNRGIVIKGAASQSANLQEWQNSAGTVRAKVDASGNVFGAVIAGNNSLVFLREENSGGLFEAKKQTAVAANPGANNAKLYFRDGTTAGTLKLVVRAGAAGAEEALFDNLDTTGTSTIAIGSGVRATDATVATASTGVGYMGLPQNTTTTGSYTIVAADAGEHIYASATRTVTIPANSALALPIGTTLTFIAGVGATMTIAITTDTMYLAGAGTTGSRTLAAHGIATAVKTTSTTWIISGNGLT